MKESMMGVPSNDRGRNRWAWLAVLGLAAALTACSSADDTAEAQGKGRPADRRTAQHQEPPPPAPTHLAITTRASAADCPDGGVLVQTGADANGNGTLESDEVTSSMPVCGASAPQQN